MSAPLAPAARRLLAIATLAAASCGPEPAASVPDSPATSVAPSVSAAAVAPPPALRQTARPLVFEGHSVCAVSGGGVACWGEDEHKVFAKALALTHPTPAAIEGVASAVAVDLASYGPGGPLLGFALDPAGTIRAFQGDKPVREVPGMTQVVDFAATYFGLCAVSSEGALRCVEGNGEFRALDTPKLTQVTAIAADAGAGHCAVHDGGKITCWEFRIDGSFLKLVVNGAVRGGEDARSVALHRDRGCAVTGEGKVQCWQMMHGDKKLEPRAIDLPEQAKQLAMGGDDACAVLASGKVACFSTSEGRAVPPPRVVEGIEGATYVARGYDGACARHGQDQISCWGKGTRGQLGNGSRAEVAEAVRVEGVKGAKAIAVAPGFSCALGAEGGVTCWGFGEGGERAAMAPFAAPELAGTKALVGVEAEVCAVDQAGKVRCFSRVADGKLALDRAMPVADLKAFWFTSGVAPVLKRSGEMALAQRMIVNDVPKVKTFALPGLKDAVEFAAQTGSLCAARKSGALACTKLSYWGRAEEAKAAVVTDLKGIGEVIAVGTAPRGGYCVVKKSGAVGCLEEPFPVGRGNAPEGDIAVKAVAGVTDAVAITRSRGDFTCVTTRAKKAACWGENDFGQLASGGLESRREAAVTLALSDVESVATSRDHACALTSAGEVHCWGNNGNGAVSGASSYQARPAPVKR